MQCRSYSWWKIKMLNYCNRRCKWQISGLQKNLIWIFNKQKLYFKIDKQNEVVVKNVLHFFKFGSKFFIFGSNFTNFDNQIRKIYLFFINFVKFSVIFSFHGVKGWLSPFSLSLVYVSASSMGWSLKKQWPSQQSIPLPHPSRNIMNTSYNFLIHIFLVLLQLKLICAIPNQF